MSTPEGVLISKILERHGARPDLRLWRNETGVFYAGKLVTTFPDGSIMLSSRRMVSAGLCVGSADLVGIHADDGRFIAIEVKAANTVTSPQQRKFRALIASMGGIAGIVHSVEDVDALLGEPPA